MTALPLVETEQGEIAAYIPTNLVSITDGQVYLDQNLFASGVLPAIDVTRSVSRIGGQAQHPTIKKEAGRMKLDYLQFLELEVFTRFGSQLEASMEAKIRKGRALRELFKQDRLDPVPPEFHMAWMVAFNEGLLDAVPVTQLRDKLAQIRQSLGESSLSLAAPREAWCQAVTAWLSAGLPES